MLACKQNILEGGLRYLTAQWPADDRVHNMWHYTIALYNKSAALAVRLFLMYLKSARFNLTVYSRVFKGEARVQKDFILQPEEQEQ